MKRILTLLLFALPLLLSAADPQPNVVRIDVRKITATPEARRAWVIAQAEGPGAGLFERDYVWILTSKVIGPNEARQLAYLFFYSSDVMGGYFDSPVVEGKTLKFAFHSELGPTEGFPVFVDCETGFTWQEGQAEKVDMLSLIRLFVSKKPETKTTEPNQALQHNDHGCHASCGRTIRASHDRG